MLHGPVDAAEDHVNLILLDELSRLGFPNAIGRCTVLEVQIELPPQLAMVALLGLLQHVQMGIEFILLRPGRAVDALQLFVLLVAAPVGAGDLHQLEDLSLIHI